MFNVSVELYFMKAVFVSSVRAIVICVPINALREFFFYVLDDSNDSVICDTPNSKIVVTKCRMKFDRDNNNNARSTK